MQQKQTPFRFVSLFPHLKCIHSPKLHPTCYELTEHPVIQCRCLTHDISDIQFFVSVLPLDHVSEQHNPVNYHQHLYCPLCPQSKDFLSYCPRSPDFPEWDPLPLFFVVGDSIQYTVLIHPENYGHSAVPVLMVKGKCDGDRIITTPSSFSQIRTRQYCVICQQYNIIPRILKAIALWEIVLVYIEDKHFFSWNEKLASLVLRASIQQWLTDYQRWTTYPETIHLFDQGILLSVYTSLKTKFCAWEKNLKKHMVNPDTFEDWEKAVEATGYDPSVWDQLGLSRDFSALGRS
jgi:hypothetical protein